MKAITPSSLLLLFSLSLASAFPEPPFNFSSTPPFNFSGPPPFTNPWEAFFNLSDCHPGDSSEVLPSLKQYLQRFGYLPADLANYTDAFDEALEAAIKAYQQNFRLEPTGFLDPSTLDLLTSPRCGVPDVINGTSTMSSSLTHGRNLYSYFPGTPMWPPYKNSLTYAFVSTSAVSIDMSTLRSVFARAFSRWSAATTLSFSETDSVSDADIKIGFYGGDHGDGEPFDGVLGTLAHSFSPTDGRFHLDAAENWVATGNVADASSNAAVDLESVAVHEIGHLLGLGHSAVKEAIMYPTIRTKTRKVELTSDDVNGIQNLYGSNPSYKGSSSTTSQEGDINDGGVVGLGTAWARGTGHFLLVLVVTLLIF